MKPRVFLSSTIRDLSATRDALRSTIDELWYEPVMSEHGEIGFLPSLSAEHSCYEALTHCDLVIAVIGRRYGSKGKDNTSITQNEVRTAREHGIPIYCFIESSVATQLRVLQANEDVQLDGFDDAPALFGFLNEVMTADRSNSVIEYSSVPDAQKRLKQQLASLFQFYLRNTNNKIQQNLSQLLSEVRQLRYSLPPEKTEQACAYFTAVKFFLDKIESHGHDIVWHYRRLIVSATNGLSSSIVPLIQSSRFADFLRSSGVRIEVMTLEERMQRGHPSPQTGQVLAASNGPLLGNTAATDLHYVLFPNLDLWIDARVLRELEDVHFDLRREYTEAVRNAVAFTARSAIANG